MYNSSKYDPKMVIKLSAQEGPKMGHDMGPKEIPQIGLQKGSLK